MKWPRALSLMLDDRGAVAPIVAIMGSVLIAASALALDVGVYYLGERDLRSATEAAALSAAINPADGLGRAQRFMVMNGYPASVVQSVEIGRYCADMTLAATARFVAAGSTACPGNGRSTAVRLRTAQESRKFLSRIMGDASPIPMMQATATAARIDEAGLAMTTGVLGVSGLVNSVLSALVGHNIALSAQQFSALLGANIDAGLFFDALATEVGETGTYADLVGRTVPFAKLMAASQVAAGASGNSVALGALQSLSTQVGASVDVPLAGLFDLGVWEKMPVGGSNEKPGLRAGLNAYQLIAYALQTGNRSTILPNGLNLGIPHVAEVKVAGSVAGTLDRPRFAFGPAGETSVSTAALRLLLKVKIVDLNGLVDGLGLSVLNTLLLNPLLSGLSVDLPLLVEVGPGTAQVSSISCGQESATDARVGVTAQSGFLRAYLGNLPANAMSPTMPAIAPASVTSVDLLNAVGLLTVNVRAVVGPVIGQSATLDFGQTSGNGTIGHPPLPGAPARIGNSSQVAPLLDSLGGALTINATILGFSTGPLVNGLLTSVGNLVGGILHALGVDPLVDTLLGALGVQAGFSDVWVTGVRCGVPVLV